MHAARTRRPPRGRSSPRGRDALWHWDRAFGPNSGLALTFIPATFRVLQSLVRRPPRACCATGLTAGAGAAACGGGAEGLCGRRALDERGNADRCAHGPAACCRAVHVPDQGCHGGRCAPRRRHVRTRSLRSPKRRPALAPRAATRRRALASTAGGADACGGRRESTQGRGVARGPSARQSAGARGPPSGGPPGLGRSGGALPPRRIGRAGGGEACRQQQALIAARL